MENLGKTIRKLREEKKLPLRKVADYLDIDQAILSKIERGQRFASREQVIKLAGFFNADESSLLVAWLSDKLVTEVADEDIALEALQAAEKKVEYLIFCKSDKEEIRNKIRQVLTKFKTIKKAWVFGSFSRDEDSPKSDIDIAIESDPNFSYFDMAEIQYVLETEINRKIDIGFLDSFKPHILNHIRPDLKLIYEK